MFLRSLVLSVAILVGIGVANAQPDALSFNLVSYSMCNPQSCMEYDYIPYTGGVQIPGAVQVQINGVCQTNNPVGAGAEASYTGGCPYDAYLEAQAYASWDGPTYIVTPFGNFSQIIGFVVAYASAGGPFGSIVFAIAQDTCDGEYYPTNPQYSGCFPDLGY